MPETPVMPDLAWSDEQMESYRSAGDPLADAVVAELVRGGQVAAVNQLMGHLVTNEYPQPAGMPEVVKRYLAQTDALPEWADLALIQAGEQVFWRYGPKLVLILHCYSLPFCYLGANGAQVLVLTERLQSNPTRRILETAQMLVDVMQPGGLTASTGRGRCTIQKVRLMHAAVRALAKEAPTWKPSYGLPINQEDLAGTLMSFAWIGLDGLEKLGVEVPAADREAYLHCWNVAGHLLGIRPELLPRDVRQAEGLALAVARHQFGPSEAGRALTRALVEMMEHILPGNIFDPLPGLLIRYFLGERWASWLGLEGSPNLELLAAPLRLFNLELGEALRQSRALTVLAERVGKLLVEAAVYVERGGTRPSFSLPTELRQQWGVNWVG
ncbi:MAG TPA: oxygenase MpaB family protein [Myxococcales bacterium]|nr:oxygenase MpaB family protein [Myxococcales bacterium]